MDRTSAMTVKEPKDGEIIETGTVYIAPGDYHLSIKSKGSDLVCYLSQSEPVNRHRPAVDVLFDSVAKLGLKSLSACILTGMGADGAKGLLKLKEAGAKTFVQDEKSCVVFGMPKAAFELGAASKQVPLEQVADVLMRLAIKR
jgi:two-component system chemotaxis response regulator CheB